LELIIENHCVKARNVLANLDNRGEQLAIGNLRSANGSINLREGLRYNHPEIEIIAKEWITRC
jgi:hypothetical protein